MNVLSVCSNFDPVTGGGEAERTFQMARFLGLADVRCRILTIDTGLSDQRKKALGDSAVIALPCLFRRFYVPRVSFHHIQRLVDESDIVHLIGHWTVLNAVVYWAIQRARKPYVVCPAGALSIFGRSKLLKKIYNLAVGSRIVKNATTCIAVTQAEKDYFIASGIAPEKVVVLPNGIAESDFLSQNTKEFRSRHSLGARRFVLFVGRLNVIKGPDLLLEAFCILKDRILDVDLVFAGPDGGMLEQLKAMAKSHGVEQRVHFVGYLGGGEKSDAYHAADLLAVPSRHEAMSIVAIEAGMCGTPVLLTDQCGFEQLQEVGGGWIVPASVQGLEQGLLNVLSQPEIIKPAGLMIKRFVSQYFTWNVVVLSYIDLYERLIHIKKRN
ncbi:MAG: glycosyltransferase family 4 protein [Polaromonas sp.]|uniref:glycosyltransferase family 4 protein n=1 Tax=Polaromonas sp. TaxID=1869339 RepID=UPI002488E19D|nr:glycosyltransferase family 4 protein [Polaromonas sp.]MDI1270356.1 glycosyltransferase family 4 protein [Polaromonas sp.]